MAAARPGVAFRLDRRAAPGVAGGERWRERSAAAAGAESCAGQADPSLPSADASSAKPRATDICKAKSRPAIAKSAGPLVARASRAPSPNSSSPANRDALGIQAVHRAASAQPSSSAASIAPVMPAGQQLGRHRLQPRLGGRLRLESSSSSARATRRAGSRPSAGSLDVRDDVAHRVVDREQRVEGGRSSTGQYSRDEVAVTRRVSDSRPPSLP